MRGLTCMLCLSLCKGGLICVQRLAKLIMVSVLEPYLVTGWLYDPGKEHLKAGTTTVASVVEVWPKWWWI
jgi:hypothetical protein